MKTFLSFLFFSSILIFESHAQKENNTWYFGKYCGLDFNSGSPVPLTNSAMTTWEGCASVSDPSTGSLLFYTNGEFVWNRNHVLMPNGSGLWGQYSSTQSSLIIPVPGSSTLYYLFTTDGGTGGFPNGGVMGYSIVDMTLAAGFGDVSTKNVALFDTTSEQLTATLNREGCKVWVLAHRWNSDEFYAYLVSDSGISAPVISAAGSVHNCNEFGQMKVSPDGSKLALPLPCDSAGNSFVEMFDFDNSTGIVSGGISLPQEHLVYGLEFSPNNHFLYTIDHNNSAAMLYKQVSQYDVTLGNAAAINASRIIVGVVFNVTTFFDGSAQLGPDGKIYVVPTDKDSLCVINSPDSAGLACNFVVPALYIINQNDHGLPNRVVKTAGPCMPTALFIGENHICPGTCTSFNNLSTGATSFFWSFSGATPAMSTDQNPTNICYSNPGTYSVTLIAANSNFSDTLTLNNFITVYPFPPPQGISQNGDTLFAIAGSVSYQWYFNGDSIPGASDYFYVASQDGDYNVVATDANDCQVEAAIFNVVTGIQKSILTESSASLIISPDPVSSRLQIIIQDERPKFKNIAIEIYNALGEKMDVNIDTKKMIVDCDQLSDGVYLVQIKSENNFFQSARFIVQR